MKNEIIKAPEINPAIMTPDQVELIKRTVAKGATDDELALFLYTSKRTGLDPLTRQVHFVKRKQWDKNANGGRGGYTEVGTIQTGIDGYRVIASRNGLAGIDDVVYDIEEGTHPNKASVTVYRLINNVRVPFTASARWGEYAATDRDGNPTAMWKKMPWLMLGKVAEALALRKAFPNDLSGLYTNEEMSQADDPNKLHLSDFDSSSVADDAEVISTGDDLGEQPQIERETASPAKPTAHTAEPTLNPKQAAYKTALQKKAAIKKLVDDKVLVPLATGLEYNKYVQETTGLALEAGNFDEIIKRLTALA